MMNFDNDCIIVANGEFPSTELPLSLLRSAKRIIACDGASGSLISIGLIPDAIVGDLDSIPSEVKREFADRIVHVENQDINDLTKSVMFAHSLGEKRLLILGATGLREDHTLGNISLLMDYAGMFYSVNMLSDHGLFTPLLDSATLDSYPGEQVSIFSMHPESEISTEGLKWQITKRRLTALWQGTLNEALGNQFSITLSAGGRVLIYRENPAKIGG